ASASAILCLRGSMSHPTRSLCTLRGRRRRRNLTQHSLPGGRYPLPGPDFHRLERASFLTHHFSYPCGCWLGPCRAKGFSHLADTTSIGGGAKNPWHDNALAIIPQWYEKCGLRRRPETNESSRDCGAHPVMPAKAGHPWLCRSHEAKSWIPAFA